jgi:hypothetical protein
MIPDGTPFPMTNLSTRSSQNESPPSELEGPLPFFSFHVQYNKVEEITSVCIKIREL